VNHPSRHAAEREIRLGLWKIHVLHHAAAREVWGLWLLDELAEHGHRLSPGTLYPALQRMEEAGWLRRTRDDRNVRARRTLRATRAGRALLEALKHDVRELYEEVVRGQEPTRGAAGSRSQSAPARSKARRRRPR
jgi:DNA-binding PadR family transcriptional regulator